MLGVGWEYCAMTQGNTGYMSKVLLFSIGGRRVCVLCEVVERAASKQVELEDVPVDHVKTIPTTC